MAIPFLNHLDLRSVSELQNAILHKTTTATASDVEGKFLYDTGTNTMQYYNGTVWINLDGAGDITAVNTASGSGLTGGATSGAVDLQVVVDGQTIEISTNTIQAKTAAIVNSGPALATGDQIYDFTTGLNISTFTNDSGYITGNETITLTGDVTGSGTTSISTTIAAAAVESGMLNNNIISGQTELTSGLVSADEFLISDAGVIKRIDTSVLQTYMQSNLTFSSGTVTGTGTANTVPKWSTGGTGIEDSSISDDGTTVTIVGNLDVQGTTTTIDSTTVAIGDNMMKYAKDNTANASDIGWYGKIVSSGDKYPGMWYDASTNITTPKFQLGIANTEPAGTGTIDTKGTLVADLEGNADTATALENSRNFSITGDISSASVAFDGTGNVALNANIDENVVGAAELKVGSNGTAGQVLASDGDGTFSWANAGTNTQLSTAAALIDVSAMAGNNTASFTHNLSSKNLIVQLYDTTSGNIVHADVDHTSNSAISIIFSLTGTELVADGIGDIRVVVIDAKNGLTDKTVSYS